MYEINENETNPGGLCCVQSFSKKAKNREP